VIKLLVPSIPPVEAALPYLRKSEEAKQFSNFGPCAKLLEERLSEYFSGPYVVTCSNCTIGLEMVYTLRMINGARGIELPALTFPATWLAANRSGLEIIPIDVDRKTWVAPGVAGYGVPTYAPVVDAAGAFGEQRVPIVRGGMTAVFSMHCTKPFGCGEGGFVVTWDEGEAQMLREFQNFGIHEGTSRFAGTNGKLSEFHAAMALAALDRWSRDPWIQLNDWYMKHLKGVIPQERPSGAYSLMPVELPVAAGPALLRMQELDVQCRRWYHPVMTKHPLFEHRGNRKHRRANPVKLPNTDYLNEHLLGLPFHLELTETDVQQVCETLERAVEELG
jgi:dTDP-4-amino-4,6-dideoxygalactose transaminase